MPTYGYLCETCGPFDVVRPMADIGEPAICLGCERSARRVFGSPGLRLIEPGVRGALDASARCADEPDVVSRPPGRSRRPTPVTRDPRHATLPRP